MMQLGIECQLSKYFIQKRIRTDEISIKGNKLRIHDLKTG